MPLLSFDDVDIPDFNLAIHTNFGETSPITQAVPGVDGSWVITRSRGRTNLGMIEVSGSINVLDSADMEAERRKLYGLQNRGLRRLEYTLRNQSVTIYCEARLKSITMDYDDKTQIDLIQPFKMNFEVPEPKWYEDVSPIWRFDTGLLLDTDYSSQALRFDTEQGETAEDGSAYYQTVAPSDFASGQYVFTINTTGTTETLFSVVIRTTISNAAEDITVSLQRIVNGVAEDYINYFHKSRNWAANAPLTIQSQYNLLQWNGQDLPGRRLSTRYAIINHPSIFRLQPGDNSFVFKVSDASVSWIIAGDYRHAYR